MADDAPTPLDVLLTTMRLRWQEGKFDEAAALAKSAAPYLHARAAAGKATLSLRALRDEQLDEFYRAAVAGDPGGEGSADTAAEQPG